MNKENEHFFYKFDITNVSLYHNYPEQLMPPSVCFGVLVFLLFFFLR